MSSRFNALGPIEMFISQRVDGVASTFYYLGTAVDSPDTDIKELYLPVMNDLGGRSASMQDVYDGGLHQISFTLNRFDYGVYNRLRVKSAGPVITEGGDSPTERGAVIRGIQDFQFLMVSTYKGVSVIDDGSQPAGRLYYYMKPLAFRESRTGTRVEEIACLLECTMGFDATTRGHTFYTENPTAWGTVSVT
jgi:hypothetical protein